MSHSGLKRGSSYASRTCSGMSGARHVAGDPVAVLQADRPDALALRDARHELVVRFVEEVERRPVGLEGLGDLRENELEQLVEIERRPQRDADLAQRLADPDFARQRRLDRAALGLSFARAGAPPAGRER